MSSIVGPSTARSVTFARVRRPSAAELMLLATVTLWALNFTMTRYILTHGFEPLAYASVRYGAAALVFSGLTYGLERSLAVRRRDLGLLLVAAALGIWLNQIAFVYALRSTTASTAALIMGVLPIVTALIAWAVRLERLSRRFLVAGGVSFCGVALVAVGSGGGLSANVGGDLLVLVTAVTWAAYSVAIAPLMRQYSPLRISAFVLVVGWVPLFLTGIPQLADQEFSLGALVWTLVVIATLGPLVLTNVLWFTAIDRVGPSRATLATNLQPFLAAIFAVALLSESISAVQVAGGVLIGIGIVLARRRAAARVPQPSE
jgi:drug/metabolite transporter (DMT)-like permease